MNQTSWSWAPLDARALALVQETESAIAADVVLVYAPGTAAVDPAHHPELRPAALPAADVERLQGIERTLGAVAIAYTRAH